MTEEGPMIESRAEPVQLRAGDFLPSFTSETLDGREVPDTQLWQRRNVVLLVAPREAVATQSSYMSSLDRRISELKPSDTSLVISHQPIVGVPRYTIVIADRWGEIVHLAHFPSATWPPIDDVVEWVEFIRAQCPECPP
jgi:hypothetical protein